MEREFGDELNLKSIVELANQNDTDLMARLSKLPEFDFFQKRRKKKLKGGLEQTVSVPKKPLTAYAIFVKKTRKEYIEVRGESKDNNDMMKELGKIWSRSTTKRSASTSYWPQRTRSDMSGS